MVNPNSLSAPLPSTPTTALQHGSGVTHSIAAEEGCDDPPPIFSPPVGNAAGGVPSHHPDTSPTNNGQGDVSDSCPYLTTRGEPSHPQTTTTENFQGSRVYDYGSPPISSGGIPSPPMVTQSPVYSNTRSGQSSTTAVDTLAGDETPPADKAAPHAATPCALASLYSVDMSSGLTAKEAAERLSRDGPNKLTDTGGITWWSVLVRQVSNSLTLVLVIAMAASYGMLDFIEGSVISAVILLNIVIGFAQDYRAEKTMQSLHSLSAPIATVVRNNGRIEKVKAEEIVAGDIVRVSVGDVVPADLRLFEGMNFETNEALLTGESLPIAKTPLLTLPHADYPLGDRTNMAYSSSTVTKGRAVGIVVATGMNSEVGRIAELLRGNKRDEGESFITRTWGRAKMTMKNVLGLVGTPLQVKLSKFALLLFGLAVLLAIIVFSANKWKINDEVLIYGICVAVAVIPESLIAVLTITMAVGTKTMAKGHVIVRKMQALEAVGGVTNICSDKTGTLTQGKMIAHTVVDGDMPSLIDSGNWDLLAEHPFDSTVKRMTVIYKNIHTNTVEAFMKGAGEVVIPNLNIPGEEKEEILNRIERLAGEGLRVLCVAQKTLPSSATCDTGNRAAVESQMNFLGLVGLYDPPRLETFEAVRKCKVAGVKVHMLTGDHIRTAAAIAHEVGIISPAMPAAQAATMVMTAGQFDALSEDEIDKLEALPLVIARCSPTTKVRMVEALHRRGAFCVMTGDGVNDSPALKRADVGIAMGLSGSDVAKDASDLVLTDDNFASIVRAVEEGRRLFDNIQKFIMHLLISNISQVVLLLIGLAFADRNGVSVFPLSPLEILWVNMITSSFLALGLGLEEAQPDIMLRPPHDLRQGVFTWEVIIDKMIYGITMGTLCLISFIIVAYGHGDGDLGYDCNHAYNSSCGNVFRARATVFAVLSFLLLLTAWEVKHFSRSLFNLDPARHKGPLSIFHTLWYNQFLFWAVFAGFTITFPVIYIPTFNTAVFKHMAITWEWGVVLGCSVAYLLVVESWKGIKRWRGIGSGVFAGRTEVRLENGLEAVSGVTSGRTSRSGTIVEAEERKG
ncbi:unnamed protein product [Tuber melanosporum]|uniref:P-type Na(+) transporter n=1 Tax=Tuber melanosporum (strain Mel28) TaxID=656061 RepID=D5GJG7_TUBMM|nr:uncharacterized protein GSTUM_00008991001 [Tuber melanosporum]CAZ84660.1 unnamed protein product [Tuber melanosporum]